LDKQRKYEDLKCISRYGQTHSGSKTPPRRERNQCVRHIDGFMLVLRDREWGAAGQSKGLLTSGRQHWGAREAEFGRWAFVLNNSVKRKPSFVLDAPESQVYARLGDAGLLRHLVLKILLRLPRHDDQAAVWQFLREFYPSVLSLKPKQSLCA